MCSLCKELSVFQQRLYCERNVALCHQTMIMLFVFTFFVIEVQCRARWTAAEANQWYANQHDWLVGANFIVSSAVNQLEMFQAPTFDLLQINTEILFAASANMNTLRIFLHDIAYADDPKGFKQRLDKVLNTCDSVNVQPILVIFDSCWDPMPKSGLQPSPIPGVHNSRWVQSPGAAALIDASNGGPSLARLQTYVEDIIGTFQNDSRILAWDLWNEPDNTNAGSYGKFEPLNKTAIVNLLLPQVFDWARSVDPIQPLITPLWKNFLSGTFDATEQLQLSLPDVISFHSYDPADVFEKKVTLLKSFARPLICTEYMARPTGSTFVSIAPVAKKLGVAAVNWGLVQGKTQTFFPWDSWTNPYVGIQHFPWVWFHDVFRPNGQPYMMEEFQLLLNLTT